MGRQMAPTNRHGASETNILEGQVGGGESIYVGHNPDDREQLCRERACMTKLLCVHAGTSVTIMHAHSPVLHNYNLRANFRAGRTLEGTELHYYRVVVITIRLSALRLS